MNSWTGSRIGNSSRMLNRPSKWISRRKRTAGLRGPDLDYGGRKMILRPSRERDQTIPCEILVRFFSGMLLVDEPVRICNAAYLDETEMNARRFPLAPRLPRSPSITVPAPAAATAPARRDPAPVPAAPPAQPPRPTMPTIRACSVPATAPARRDPAMVPVRAVSGRAQRRELTIQHGASPHQGDRSRAPRSGVGSCRAALG